MKMNLKKKWRAASLALLLGVGVFESGSAFAQAEEKQYPYYEGSSWNQFHNRYDYLKGTPDKICAAAVQAWSKTTEVTHLDPNYTHIWEGTYKGNPRISPSLTYILCDADLKQSLIYPTQPESNRVIVSENAGASVLIEKFEEFAPNHDPCEEPPNARGTYQRPDYCDDKCDPTPLPLPPNGKRCGATPPKKSDGGLVACDPMDEDKRQPCVWISSTDPQADSILKNAAYNHEMLHKKDSNYSCITKDGDEYKNYLGAYSVDLAMGEVMGYVVEMKYLEEYINTCCTDKCRGEVKTRHDEIKGSCKTHADEFFKLMGFSIKSNCEERFIKLNKN